MRRSSVVAVLLLLASIRSDAQSTPHEKLAREVYKELIEINTVDSVGSVTKAVEALAARFKAAGFPASDVHVLIPPGAPTKGNLVVRYHGRSGPGAPKPILLLAHPDVGAALRADWPRGPVVLNEADELFLWRGTSDDKSMASIFATNLLWMKQEGVVPDRDIILALTADEEGGAANGAHWLAREHKDLIDAEYAINEGGDGALVNGKPVTNAAQAGEKVSGNCTLTALHTGGHSCKPRPDNPIYELTKSRVRISAVDFPVVLNPVATPFLTQPSKAQPKAEIA